jgi:hypothetical protein
MSKQTKHIFAKVKIVEEEQNELSRSLLVKKGMNSSIQREELDTEEDLER